MLNELIPLLTHPDDRRGAFVDIWTGAGGPEARYFAQAMCDMISRCAERHGLDVLRVFDRVDDQGLCHAALRVRGDYAYGLLQSESGIHRLIRIPPTDSHGRRHMAFVAVTVAPVLDAGHPEIPAADLQYECEEPDRVSVTHIPSGIQVACHAHATVEDNRALALSALRSQLHAKQRSLNPGEQIRTITMAPHHDVTDSRTDVSSTDVIAVLDGHLEPFIRAWLQARNRMP